MNRLKLAAFVVLGTSIILSLRTFKVQQKLAYSKKHVGTDALVCPAERSSAALRTAVCYKANKKQIVYGEQLGRVWVTAA